MSWLGLALLLLCAYLAWQLVGVLLKIAMFALALVGAYWFAAPYLGWPTVSDLFYVLGPDFGGQRIEQVLQPGAIADAMADRVVDSVVDRIVGPPAGSPPEAVDALPEPPAEGTEAAAADAPE